VQLGQFSLPIDVNLNLAYTADTVSRASADAARAAG
jgi:hypothetical protein